jgi:glycosyltransferase involved in cell wall biosynthesis
LLTVLDAADPDRRVCRVTTGVGTSYELGTDRYRASVILELLRRDVPVGATLVLSDEPAVWRASHAAANRYRAIGVLHADDEHYYRLAVRYGDAAAALVGVSRRIVRTAGERLGSLERLHHIPCGIALGAAPTRTAGGRPARLIWAGRIEQRPKRVLDLPQILLRVRALGYDATLDIVGDGPDAASVREAVRAARVEQHVQWHGWRTADEVRAALRNADVLVLPSDTEGMPIVVMEALASGCGVVVSAVGGLEDYVGHSLGAGCYRTHPVGDLHAAATAIATLLALPPMQRATSARALAEAEFSIERCVDRYTEVVRRTAPTSAVRREPRAWARLAALTSLPVSSLRRLRLWWGGVRSRRFAERAA